MLLIHASAIRQAQTHWIPPIAPEDIGLRIPHIVIFWWHQLKPGTL